MMKQPEGFVGEVVIEWPRPRNLVPGFLVTVLIKDEMITTASSIDVHAEAEGVAWVELTMFADEDGRPIYDGPPRTKDDQIITGTFPFLVAEMRVSDR